MELPTKQDFLKVDGASLYHPQNAHFSILKYKKMRINMRSVIDFREFDEELVIFDDEKNEEYKTAMEEWHKNNGGGNVHQMANGHGMIITQPQAPPQAPTKKIRLIGTMIVYMNNTERLLMMNIEDWEDKYFGYLEIAKLNLLGLSNNNDTDGD